MNQMPRLSDDGKRETTATLVCVRAASHSASLTRHFPNSELCASFRPANECHPRVMQSADAGWLGAVGLMFRLVAFGTLREKETTLRMQRIVRKMKNAQDLIQAAPETQPYRNEAQIRKLFDRNPGFPFSGDLPDCAGMICCADMSTVQ